MIQRVLAWSSLALAMLFVILSLAILFAGASLGAMVKTLMWAAIGALVLAMLLAVALLVMAAFS
ncbi:MAG: hypothetical protein RLZZ111_1939 [Planctomycetota bacterium]|jgi:hypothetical protein